MKITVAKYLSSELSKNGAVAFFPAAASSDLLQKVRRNKRKHLSVYLVVPRGNAIISPRKKIKIMLTTGVVVS